MIDINRMIANNIVQLLKKQGRKQMELAEGIGVSKQTMSKMLSGGRIINAFELKQIADFLHVSMDRIVQVPASFVEVDPIHTFMGRVETEEAREALRVADEVSEMILFHSRVRRNGSAAMSPMED